jgi:membrane peptidoglycan carboxypeptidase
VAGRRQPDPGQAQYPPDYRTEYDYPAQQDPRFDHVFRPGQAQQSPTPETFFTQQAVGTTPGKTNGRTSGRASRKQARDRRPPAPPVPPRKGLIDYPRAGKRGPRRWLPSWKLLLGSTFGTAAALVVAFVVFYAATPIPTVSASSALPQTSLVFYSDGTQIGQFKKEQRTLVSLDRVPDHVEEAVLASEDRSFYRNKGVSPRGMIRAAWNNSRGGSLQGGSTITQQYVKNFFLGSDRSVKRKAREFVISLKVYRQVPKKKILEDYLNKIYFGRNAYGIQAAAQAYFKKDVNKLTVSQGAFLAGIINGPELYDPNDGNKSAAAATGRWQSVLVAMTAEGWLTQAEADTVTAAGLPPVIKPTKAADRTRQRGYLMDMVAAEALAKAGLTREQLETEGLMIRTTFDRKLIEKGIAAVDDVLGKRSTWPTGTQVGIASIEPGTGAVRAVYAGDDERSRNTVTQDQVIAGSTMKPFALIPALEGTNKEEPLSLRSRFSGRSPYKLQETKVPVKNFGKGDGQQFGMIDLMTATANSVNTVYAQLNERVTPGVTRQTALKAGLPESAGIENNQVNVLGSAAPHVLDMASAYATIAAEGKRAKPYMITSINRIEDKGVVYTPPREIEQVFDRTVMADTTHALRQVVERGSGSYAQNLGRPAAGKTGTSSGNKSAWFVGFTPQLSTAVALFNISGQGQETVKGWGRYQGEEITGGSFPVRLWTTYMREALDGVEVERFPQPTFDGEVVNPAPEPKPSPSAEPSPSGSPGEPGPTSSPPDGQPSGEPSPSGLPLPSDGTQSPQPSDGGNGGNNGNGNSPNGVQLGPSVVGAPG